MRQIFTLISCLALYIMTAAQSSKINIIDTSVIICRKPLLKDGPLIVINGIIANESDLRAISPDDIESISVLKSGIQIGCRPARAAIIITTKTANQRVICVKDMFSRETIAAASVALVSFGNKKDTIHRIADSPGKVVLDNLKYEKEYVLQVSNIGYKSFTSVVNLNQIRQDYTVLLVSDYKTLEEVTVKASQCVLARRIMKFSSLDPALWGQFRCLAARVTMKIPPDQGKEEVQRLSFKVYPNPVQRSQKVNIEFTSKIEGKLSISLCNIDGKQIVSNEYKASKGINSFEYFIDSKLASGVYAIQIIDQENILIKTEKLIIQ